MHTEPFLSMLSMASWSFLYLLKSSLEDSSIQSLRHSLVASVLLMYTKPPRNLLQPLHQESRNIPMSLGDSCSKKSCRHPTGRMSASM